jgi:hypothetical protein
MGTDAAERVLCAKRDEQAAVLDVPVPSTLSHISGVSKA